jgi:hypothetical protein
MDKPGISADNHEKSDLVVGEVISDEILDMISGASFAKGTWKKAIPGFPEG